ncbi:FxLYD domain-containing protein [Streptomyces viridiviolaceus]|uniref:FxLYD domain-containing protein n=1 Tax=Streptomyces viridiviolaceus TaxID=68282 RepID=A0ABW2E505_9ACTN|nr:FxLYD domain-containing protein [Streptomyces viridiviolaceus]
MSTGTSTVTARPRRRPVVLTVCAVITGMAALVSCGGDGDGEGAPTPTPTAPDTASFTGEVPSALASEAESRKAEARASASAAASSASAAASAFEASVSAEAERARAEAQKQLKNVDGRGNATNEVSMTGLPLSETNGVRALVVNITNRTDETASYAVQVDFSDADGKVVETRYVGAQDLAPGKQAHPLAISRKPPEPPLTAKIAKAQRY